MLQSVPWKSCNGYAWPGMVSRESASPRTGQFSSLLSVITASMAPSDSKSYKKSRFLIVKTFRLDRSSSVVSLHQRSCSTLMRLLRQSRHHCRHASESLYLSQLSNLWIAEFTRGAYDLFSFTNPQSFIRFPPVLLYQAVCHNASLPPSISVRAQLFHWYLHPHQHLFWSLRVYRVWFLLSTRAAIFNFPATIVSHHRTRKYLLMFYLLLGPLTSHCHHSAVVFSNAKMGNSNSLDKLRVHNLNLLGEICCKHCKLYVRLFNVGNCSGNQHDFSLVMANLQFAVILLARVLILDWFDMASRQWHF